MPGGVTVRARSDGKASSQGVLMRGKRLPGSANAHISPGCALPVDCNFICRISFRITCCMPSRLRRVLVINRRCGRQLRRSLLRERVNGPVCAPGDTPPKTRPRVRILPSGFPCGRLINFSGLFWPIFFFQIRSPTPEGGVRESGRLGVRDLRTIPPRTHTLNFSGRAELTFSKSLGHQKWGEGPELSRASCGA